MGGPPTAGSPGSLSGSRGKDSDAPPGTFFLGRYRVVDEIGVGGMASVHLARMDGPGGFQKWVAIKRIHPHLVEDDQFVDMFLDEARIAAGINHANVAQVFDLGKDDNTYWIAMEYLHGEPLREVMRRAEERGLSLSPELAARICADAAEGLHAAHELRGKNGQLLGLVHRDVTPHNLFITYDGYTKVVDFGIAKVADRLSSTRAGTLKGKLAYMSPEQVTGAKDIDRTTDIFALGVVLWELTTNQRLFRMDTDLDTLEKVQKCEVPRPSMMIPDYPLELEQIVLKALAKDRRQRFATAREFSRALQNFLMRMGAYVGPEEVAQFTKQVFADRIEKREQHLAWAAEVTSTINVDQLKGGSSGMDEDDDLRRRSASRPTAAPASGVAPIRRGAQGESQMAASSLMDDDEDVPTMVANRDPMDRPTINERAAPRPAAGMPAANMPGMGGPGMHGGMPGMGGGGMPGAGPPMGGPPPAQFPGAPPPAPYGARPGGGFPPAQFPQAPPGARTAAFPSDDDLGSTMALPNHMNAPQGMPDQPRSAYGQGQGPGMSQGYGGAGGAGLGNPGQGYGQPPQPSYNGQSYGSTTLPQGYPPAGQSTAPSFGPAPTGMSMASPQAFPPMQMPGPGGQQPQSQIETALSLPRPDPAALWLAQQDAQKRGARRNTGVIIAVVALTALCIIGIIALVYFKMRQGAPAPNVSPGVTPAVGAAALPPAESPARAAAAPAEAEVVAAVVKVALTTTAASPTTLAAAVAAPGAPEVSAPAPAPAAKPGTGTGSGAAPSPSATASSPAEKEEPGYLSINCKPFCDEVLDNGRSLGAPPVVRAQAAPGQHRITVRRGSEKKVISVLVASGQVTTQLVTLK